VGRRRCNTGSLDGHQTGQEVEVVLYIDLSRTSYFLAEIKAKLNPYTDYPLCYKHSMKLCNEIYSTEDASNETLGLFNDWDFDLSSFQKYAVEALHLGHHVLVSAPTGSGKTLVANAAIRHSSGHHERVIFLSPIKALSNQKFHEFQEKFPEKSVGIITGNVCFNPEADVLVMTTEILRNTLFQRQMVKEGTLREEQVDLHFEMDIENDLSKVIFDEVHYLNDPNRGGAVEETMMMLPESIQLIMLSATLDKPEKLANWIEGRQTNGSREVWLCIETKRQVPLVHYSFTVAPASQLKKLDKAARTAAETLLGKPLVLKKEGEAFREGNYRKTMKCLRKFELAKVHVNRFYAVGQLVEYMAKNDQLPAIVFVFSRRQTEVYASKINRSLFDEGSKLPSTMADRCKKMILKLPNYKEFLVLPEYLKMVRLLEKGVAFHHAGVPQVLRELVEKLFEQGCIKLLFATETFAVGLNMPVKSAVFPSLDKWDGKTFRTPKSHEYTQMAGRAGRRGMDNIGFVYHLSNSIHHRNTIDAQTYRNMLDGQPQALESNFKIHFNLLLRLLGAKKFELANFASESMLASSIQKEKEWIILQLEKAREAVSSPLYVIPVETLEDYRRKSNELAAGAKKKRRKVLKRQIDDIKASHKRFQADYERFIESLKAKEDVKKYEERLVSIEQYIQGEVSAHLEILERRGFIEGESPNFQLTNKGHIAASIQEMHCLAMADILSSGSFDELTAAQIAGVLSIFTDINISDEFKLNGISYIEAPTEVKNAIAQIGKAYNDYHDIILEQRLPFVGKNEIHYDLVELILNWCESADASGCAKVYAEAEGYGIGTGTFIKAVLKINNMVNELEKVCALTGDSALLSKIRKIPELTIKSIATNQSLYL